MKRNRRAAYLHIPGTYARVDAGMNAHRRLQAGAQCEVAMKHDAAERVLSDVLTKYGAAVCDTPQILETLLRKHGRACLKEVGILTAALRSGVVSQLRSEVDADQASLAKLMVLDTHVPPDQAEWVVAAWAAAISHAPAKVAALRSPSAEQQPAAMFSLRSVAVLAVAAATGAIAYLAFVH